MSFGIIPNLNSATITNVQALTVTLLVEAQREELSNAKEEARVNKILEEFTAKRGKGKSKDTDPALEKESHSHPMLDRDPWYKGRSRL